MPSGGPTPAEPVVVGRYQILGELGTGGMGVVHLARLAGPGGFERLVALKTIHPHLARKPAFVGMFLDEARIAARIRHPQVVSVFDVGEADGSFYMAMDYVSGESLSRLIPRSVRNQRPISFPLATYLMAGVLDGLHAAHESSDALGRPLGVIHRDVSPKNILVGYDGLPRILDFGIAKARDRITDTGAGPNKGTAGYMAPEQLLHQPSDRRVDVFAAGVVLWEMTVGMRLFKGANDVITADNIRSGRVPLPSSIRDEYPRDLEEIVMRALKVDRDRRFNTAREMANALRQCSVKGASPVDVEALMAELFTDRLAQRQEIERAATQDVRLPVPLRLLQDPTSNSDESSSSSPPTLRADALLELPDPWEGEDRASVAEPLAREAIVSVESPEKRSPLSLVAMIAAAVVFAATLVWSLHPKSDSPTSESPTVTEAVAGSIEPTDPEGRSVAPGTDVDEARSVPVPDSVGPPVRVHRKPAPSPQKASGRTLVGGSDL